jgi:hypothetical protein
MATVAVDTEGFAADELSPIACSGTFQAFAAARA